MRDGRADTYFFNDKTVSTDTLLLVWGISLENKSTSGQFHLEECKININILGLKAVLFGSYSYCYSFSNSLKTIILCNMHQHTILFHLLKLRDILRYS